MNAVFDLEVNSFRKPVKDFLVLHQWANCSTEQPRCIAEAISIVIGSWQGNSKLVFRIL